MEAIDRKIRNIRNMLGQGEKDCLYSSINGNSWNSKVCDVHSRKQ